jgi:hypothetical protein
MLTDRDQNQECGEWWGWELGKPLSIAKKMSKTATRMNMAQARQ